MARPKNGFTVVINDVLTLIDGMEQTAKRDGVIDVDEQFEIDRARFIVTELEVGNRAQLRADAMRASWDIEDSPHTTRMIRELKADIGNRDELHRRRIALGFDDGPDDGAPQLKAA